MASRIETNTYILLVWLLFGISGNGWASAENPHELSPENQGVNCLSCHTEQPQNTGEGLFNSKNRKVDRSMFKNDGVAMCTGCHSADDGHKVGLKIDFETPADLPLGETNKMTCLTCHHTHGSLGTDKPQASYSFIDRVVDAERLHKSYLLRRTNADGELCLICHEVKEGPK